MEFRGLPPSARDQLFKELGDKIAVQESDWNCGNLVTPASESQANSQAQAFAEVDADLGNRGYRRDSH
jgi:hypothetical protein